MESASALEIPHVAPVDQIDLVDLVNAIHGKGITGRANLRIGGKGFCLKEATAKAFGESLERFLSFIVGNTLNPETLLYGSYEKLSEEGHNVYPPEGLPLYSEQQYENKEVPSSPFTADSEVSWVKGVNITKDNEEVYLPTQIIYLGYVPKKEEAKVAYPTSTGLACKYTKTGALLRAIYEFIERDANLMTWFSKLPLTLIDIRNEPLIEQSRAMKKLLKYTDGGKKELYVLNNTLDIKEVKVITALLMDPYSETAAMTMGAEARLDIRKAMNHSLLELGQGLIAIKHLRQREEIKDIDKDAPMEKLVNYDHVLAYYGFRENANKVKFIIGDNYRGIEENELRDFASEEEELEELIRVLKSHDLDVIVYDFTPEGYETAVNVIKVYIPQLVPNCIPCWPYLGHPRLLELPQKLGVTDRVLRYDELNTDPSPFP